MGKTKDLFILVPKCGNRKTGPMPVSTSNHTTCPPACKMQKACYAAFGRLGMMWYKLDHGLLVNMTGWTEFCQQVRAMKPKVQIWRHNQAGDLPGRNNRLHRGRCLQLARANAADGYNRGGYTYTHYPVLPVKGEVPPAVARHNAEVVREMNMLGFTVNLSADNVQQADALADLGIAPVVTVLHEDDTHGVCTPAGRKVHVCPKLLHPEDTEINCKRCGTCQVQARGVIVGFPAHGAGKKQANKIAGKVTH